MRRPQISELMRSESCQSGPVSSSTTFLPALASVAANTEPDAPAPAMTASTFSPLFTGVAMSPPLERHDVRLIGDAERFVPLDRAVDDIDRVTAQHEVNKARRRPLPARQLVLAHQVHELALRVGGEPREPLIALRGGCLVDCADRRLVEIRVRRPDVQDARLEQRFLRRHGDLLIDEVRDARVACARHERLAHRFQRLRFARLQQAEWHASRARLARRKQYLSTADRECERTERRAAHELVSSDHGCLLPNKRPSRPHVASARWCSTTAGSSTKAGWDRPACARTSSGADYSRPRATRGPANRCLTPILFAVPQHLLLFLLDHRLHGALLFRGLLLHVALLHAGLLHLPGHRLLHLRGRFAGRRESRHGEQEGRNDQCSMHRPSLLEPNKKAALRPPFSSAPHRRRSCCRASPPSGRAPVSGANSAEFTWMASESGATLTESPVLTRSRVHCSNRRASYRKGGCGRPCPLRHAALASQWSPR